MEKMTYYFLGRNEQIIFVRSDATKFVVDEGNYELDCTFPIDAEKSIQEGMKIGFFDIDDEFQMYDIIQPEENPFDMTVSILAEHSGMAELLDEVVTDRRPTNDTAAQAAAIALDGSRWSVRNAVQTGTTSCRFWYISRWAALKKVMEDWAVTIKFVWQISGNAIVGRYIDIRSSQSINRGKRFEIGKDISALLIKYDDSNVATALIGRGRGVETGTDDDPSYGRKISFASVVWSIANGDPADKPEGQEYVEDVAATAAYGRNGRPRVKVVEFDNCTDPEELLSATWQVLQRMNRPAISINCTVADFERILGYKHEAVRKGDHVAVIADQTNIEIETAVENILRDYIAPENTKISLGSQITQTADEIIAEISRAMKVENSLTGRIVQMDETIGTISETVDTQGELLDTHDELLDLHDDEIGFVVAFDDETGDMYINNPDEIISSINTRSSSLAQISGSKLDVDEQDCARWGVYTDGTLTAGVIASKITEDSSQTSASVKMGTYVNNLLDAGAMITKITDPTVGTTYQAAFGTYINEKLDAGVMVQKITGDTSQSSVSVKMGTYVNDLLDAGVMVEKITGDTSQTSIAVKMGTYVDGLIDAGSVIQKITDPSVGSTYQATFGTYINGKLDAGAMITKITDPNVGTTYQTAFGTYINDKLDAGTMVEKITGDTSQTTTTVKMGTYVNGLLDAGTIVERITGDTSQSSASVKMGTYVNGLMDAGTIITKITDANVGSTYQATFGTYINGKLDAGTMITKITDQNVGSTYQATFGTYINNKLDAGIMVQKINGQSTTSILGSKVTIGNTATTVDGKFADVEVEIQGKLSVTTAQATYATIGELDAEKARFDNLTSGTAVATGIKATFLESTSSLTIAGNGYRACLLYHGTDQWGTVLGTSQGGIDVGHYHSITATEGTGANAGKILIALGNVQTSQGSTNFNIAATQFYQDGVAASQNSAWALAYGKVAAPSQGTDTSFTVQVPDSTYNTSHTYTFTIQKGDTPGSSGYASVALSGTVVGRIAIGDWYDAGVTAGEAVGKDAVTINKGSWNQGIISFTKSVGAASTKSVQLTAASASWSGNSASVQIWDGTAADAQHGSFTGYTVTVDASARYTAGETAGKNAVTITKGSWSQGIIQFTKSEGTASTKSVQLCAASPSWNGNTATVQIWDGTAADAQHGSNTGYTVTVTAPDQTVYYWEGGTKYSFPSGGKRLTNGVDIMVGTSTSNRHWVLCPSASTLTGTWSGTGNTKTYTLTGSNVTTKTVTFTGSSGSWSGNSRTITVSASDNSDPLFQYTITAPSASLSSSWSSSGSGTLQHTYTVSSASSSKSITIQDVYYLELSGNIWASGDEYYQHCEASLRINDGGTTIYKNKVDCYGGVDVTAAVNYGKSMVSNTMYYWENGNQYTFPSGGKRLTQGVDIMVGTSTSNRYWVLCPSGGGGGTIDIPSTQIYTTSSAPSGATKLNVLRNRFIEAMNDSDFVVFRVDCGSSQKWYYMEP